MYTQDWIMRHIQMLTQFIAHTFFGKDLIEYVVKDENSYTQADMLFGRLLELIGQKKICEAEDLLFREMDSTSIDYLELAVDFYQRLGKLSGKELTDANFSREEISEGLDEVMKKYGIENPGI